MAEILEIQDTLPVKAWTPFVGDETYGLLRGNARLAESGMLNAAGQRVLDETLRIMKSCGNPLSNQNNDTGLVLGYVQSGKTLSFTTLAALARDNHYPIVIVIGGTSINLLEQSTSRLRKDLRIDNRYGFEQKWVQITNPRSQQDADAIVNALDQWASVTYPREKCRTILITVMKNGAHLFHLRNLLQPLNLEHVPTLIIDDEGDQASLNTRAAWAARQRIDIEDLTENDVSTIYRRINGLRNIFPHHTFLQYTATPQANLFINIMDRLSPNFIKLLVPGDEYIGGYALFRENRNLLVEISLADLSRIQGLHEPPESLLYALKLFYLGVVAGEVLELYKEPSQHNRSMLIHPSRLQGDHNIFWRWVNNIRESWRRLLEGDDLEEKEVLLAEFSVAYEDLRKTVPNLPSFIELTSHNLIHAIKYTPVIEVNSRGGVTPQINWQESYSWILVGGQSMDRGFTVEGLTVTYMPRNIGVGNVDTVHQRARFYGYKRNYLGYCRIFLDQATIDTYDNIVDHEEDIRAQLEGFDVNNRHLNDWDRRAVLDGMLSLTRANVLYDDLARDYFGDEWFRINAPHDTEEFIETNRNIVYAFVNNHAAYFREDDGHVSRTDDQKHLVGTFSLQESLNDLLNVLRFTRETDSATYSSLRGVLKRYAAKNPDESCLIYLMSARSLDDWRHRVRRLDGKDEIQQLFQGRNPKTGEIIYPGDSEIKNEKILTIQIHLLDIRDTEYKGVPTVAIWVPNQIGMDIIRRV